MGFKRHNGLIFLACSAGGHLTELRRAIGTIEDDYPCCWLTMRTPFNEEFLNGRNHVYLKNLRPGSPVSVVVNAVQAAYHVLTKRPRVVITTGAGITIPTVYFAKKLLGAKVIFINSAADVTSASRTPLWIERYADLFLVQWEELMDIFPNAVCTGPL